MSSALPGDVAEQLRHLGVLQQGHFRLTSGKHSDTYLQLAQALQHPWAALDLGRHLAMKLHDVAPDVIVSPALGGILAGFSVAAALDRRFLFAERGADGRMALRRGQRLAPGERVVVVEDVITTGASALEVAQRCREAGGDVVGLAAIVDRLGSLPAEDRPQPQPITLLSVAPVIWEADGCPLCADGLPLDSPGSRHVTSR